MRLAEVLRSRSLDLDLDFWEIGLGEVLFIVELVILGLLFLIFLSILNPLSNLYCSRFWSSISKVFWFASILSCPKWAVSLNSDLPVIVLIFLVRKSLSFVKGLMKQFSGCGYPMLTIFFIDSRLRSFYFALIELYEITSSIIMFVWY